MSDEQSGQPQGIGPTKVMSNLGRGSCELDAEGHCITCSDEALQARVMRVDQELGVAFVTINETNEANEAIEEVDITLIDDVVPGDVILVHGGVAISNGRTSNA